MYSLGCEIGCALRLRCPRHACLDLLAHRAHACPPSLDSLPVPSPCTHARNRGEGGEIGGATSRAQGWPCSYTSQPPSASGKHVPGTWTGNPAAPLPPEFLLICHQDSLTIVLPCGRAPLPTHRPYALMHACPGEPVRPTRRHLTGFCMHACWHACRATLPSRTAVYPCSIIPIRGVAG